ncbi:MAG: HlyD family secretion protein [Mangrovibacterium sp.]
MNRINLAIISLVVLSACADNDFDASGNFEADEVIVSAQQTGLLLSYQVEEGMPLKSGQDVGKIDVRLFQLQKEQTEASIHALEQKTYNSSDQTELVRRQLEVQNEQLGQLKYEQERTRKLLDSDAATQKQLDDLNAAVIQLQKQIEVTKQQLKLTSYNTTSQNQSILSEKGALEKVEARFQEEINRGTVINPIDGVVLVNYALQGEMQTIGKPLYKIADISTLYLRAYITGVQLSEIQLGQKVIVRIDKGENDYKEYEGEITWISAKAEFSPKTIQTKDERANLVYAIKIKVPNDGYLKIGMYGEVLFESN